MFHNRGLKRNLLSFIFVLTFFLFLTPLNTYPIGPFVINPPSASPDSFSPDSDNIDDTATISAKLVFGLLWPYTDSDQAQIPWSLTITQGEQLVKTFNNTSIITAPQKTVDLIQVWDGKDSQGLRVSQGTYAYQFTADHLGASARSANGQIVVTKSDNTAPMVSDFAPADGAYTNDTIPTISARFSDNGEIDIASVKVTLDGIVIPAYATGDGFSYTPGLGLTDGVHSVTVEVKDIAGNLTQGPPWQFTVDTVTPEIAIDALNSPVNIALQTIAGTYTGDDISAITVNDIAATIDNIGKTYEALVSLDEGDNFIEAIASDLAGNSSSSDTALVYDPQSVGEVITPGGGDLTSSNGNITLDIPQGALSQDTYIWMSPHEISPTRAPKDSSPIILTAIQCGPDGTVFNEPIAMNYTLTQAEVPGTPVELALYDPVSGTMTPTGQTAAVGADGYAVDFSLDHFSIYAVTKNLISQGGPIGSGVEVPLPDMLTGAFSHAISFTVPPARKDMQPNLALVYRSSNGNSWTGMGFELSPGYIVRSTKFGPPTYNDQEDTFYYVTDGGTVELLHLVDNLYQAKIEASFSKFYKETDDSWRVLGKDGSVLRFGQTQDSKETATAGTYAWYVTKATDTNGNYIDYSYTKDQNKAYLSRIDYTGNEDGTSPTNMIEFFVEDRDDISSSFISRSKITVAKRLKEITMRVNSSLVWRYELNYSASPDTDRSLLQSITQYAGDGEAFPTQRFTYQEAK